MIQDFEPAFAYGLKGEELVRRYGQVMAEGEAGCEVKRKRRLDLTFYVEQEQITQHGQGPTRPSGVNATNAELFAYVLADTGIVIVLPTALLRHAAGTPIGTKATQPQLHNGNPTRGVLLTLTKILNRYEPDKTGWAPPPDGWKETEEIALD